MPADQNAFSNLIWQIADLLRGPYRPPLDFEKLEDDPDHIHKHLVSYIMGFSKNVHRIFERFFEKLIRRFNELANEPAGDHLTPRAAIRPMVNLRFIAAAVPGQLDTGAAA